MIQSYGPCIVRKPIDTGAEYPIYARVWIETSSTATIRGMFRFYDNENDASPQDFTVVLATNSPRATVTSVCLFQDRLVVVVANGGSNAWMILFKLVREGANFTAEELLRGECFNSNEANVAIRRTHFKAAFQQGSAAMPPFFPDATPDSWTIWWEALFRQDANNVTVATLEDFIEDIPFNPMFGRPSPKLVANRQNLFSATSAVTDGGLCGDRYGMSNGTNAGFWLMPWGGATGHILTNFPQMFKGTQAFMCQDRNPSGGQAQRATLLQGTNKLMWMNPSWGNPGNFDANNTTGASNINTTAARTSKVIFGDMIILAGANTAGTSAEIAYYLKPVADGAYNAANVVSSTVSVPATGITDSIGGGWMHPYSTSNATEVWKLDLNAVYRGVNQTYKSVALPNTTANGGIQSTSTSRSDGVAYMKGRFDFNNPTGYNPDRSLCILGGTSSVFIKRPGNNDNFDFWVSHSGMGIQPITACQKDKIWLGEKFAV